jgi:hypothetical protein
MLLEMQKISTAREGRKTDRKIFTQIVFSGGSHEKKE